MQKCEKFLSNKGFTQVKTGLFQAGGRVREEYNRIKGRFAGSRMQGAGCRRTLNRCGLCLQVRK